MNEAIIAGTSPRSYDRYFTYGDYRTWPEAERWEIIGGQSWAMSPAPSRSHQRLLGILYAQMEAFFSGKACIPHIAPVDVCLPSRESEMAIDDIDDVVQPDAFVVCDPAKLREAGIVGAPDFIIEVLSPSTAMKDQSEKRILYERNGVREYWVVNPKTLEVFIYSLLGTTYGLPVAADLRNPTAVGIFPGLFLKAHPKDLN